MVRGRQWGLLVWCTSHWMVNQTISSCLAIGIFKQSKCWKADEKWNRFAPVFRSWMWIYERVFVVVVRSPMSCRLHVPVWILSISLLSKYVNATSHHKHCIVTTHRQTHTDRQRQSIAILAGFNETRLLSDHKLSCFRAPTNTEHTLSRPSTALFCQIERRKWQNVNAHNARAHTHRHTPNIMFAPNIFFPFLSYKQWTIVPMIFRFIFFFFCRFDVKFVGQNNYTHTKKGTRHKT